MADSFRTYGFEYAYNGRRYTYSILAPTEAIAREMAAAMRESTFVGELVMDRRKG